MVGLVSEAECHRSVADYLDKLELVNWELLMEGLFLVMECHHRSVLEFLEDMHNIVHRCLVGRSLPELDELE